jgi:alpha-N-arabinofuranosidase
MTTDHPENPGERKPVRTTVSVDGRRWRGLSRTEALLEATGTDQVYVVDKETGAVRFGDGVHGAQPPSGAVVRVSYRLEVLETL